MKKEDSGPDQALLAAQIHELMERFEEEEKDKQQKERDEEDERSDRDTKREEADLQPLSRMIHGAIEDEPEDREVEPTFDEGR